MIFIDLYQFQIESTIYRYTSSTRAYTHEGNTYSPIPIGRSGLVTTDEISKNTLDVTLDFRNELSTAILKNGKNKVSLTLLRSINGTVENWFVGTLADFSAGGAKLTLSFSNNFSKLKQQGAKRNSAKLCPLALYGRECGASVGSMSQLVNLVSINGTSVVFSSQQTFENGFFEFGFIKKYLTDERVFIISHTGNTLVLKNEFSGLTLSDSVVLLPGCDKKTSTCKNRFNNLYNYGGFPNLTLNNPFSSSDAL